MSELMLAERPAALHVRELPSLGRWIEDARLLAPIAESLARTAFVPKEFQGKPAEIVAAILAGAEVGMGPMASLRAIAVINGRPSLSALALRALVQAAGHQIRVVESTSSRCIVEGRRVDDEDWQRSVWTTERAKTAGLLARDTWRSQPTAMLVARATSECARLVAADALLGFAYSSEELADGDAAEVAPSPPKLAANTRKVARRAIAPAPDAEPSNEDSAGPGGVPLLITAPQQTKLHVLLREHGLTDRGEALARVAYIIGRDLNSTAELTLREAASVIDELELPFPPPERRGSAGLWPPVATPPDAS